MAHLLLLLLLSQCNLVVGILLLILEQQLARKPLVQLGLYKVCGVRVGGYFVKGCEKDGS